MAAEQQKKREGKRLLLVVAAALVLPAAAVAGNKAMAHIGVSKRVAAAESGFAVLLGKRPQGKNLAGFWEFPSGKPEHGETPDQALIRELHEELGIRAEGEDLQPLSFACCNYRRFHLLMPLYICRKFGGYPQSCEGQELCWVHARDLAADYRIYQAYAAADTEKAKQVNCRAASELESVEKALSVGVRFPLPPADIALIPPLLAAMAEKS